MQINFWLNCIFSSAVCANFAHTDDLLNSFVFNMLRMCFVIALLSVSNNSAICFLVSHNETSSIYQTLSGIFGILYKTRIRSFCVLTTPTESKITLNTDNIRNSFVYWIPQVPRETSYNHDYKKLGYTGLVWLEHDRHNWEQTISTKSFSLTYCTLFCNFPFKNNIILSRTYKSLHNIHAKNKVHIK